MREELMKEALCWELEDKVTAEYAHGQELLYFCPMECCLEPVFPERRTNVYFKARNRHKQGCPNEAPLSEPSPVPGVQRTKLPADPVIPTPTHLGPSLLVKKKGICPTPDDLKKLAKKLTASLPRHPGTLEEVVIAWTRMSSIERKSSRLNIQGSDTTYHNAFHFLARAADDINQLPCQSGIIFGSARIIEVTDPNGISYYLVDSVKKFSHGNNKLPIRLVVKKGAEAPSNISSLVDKDCTFFWHGPPPSLGHSGNSFRLNMFPPQKYQGILVLEGNFLP